ncbi:hypothetical protein CAOG_005142 [Capsaspora owczarzaki ATCC 30864]|uniref:CCAAT-binding factor domain-containing protein n=1 Tax=Capsaspora owczarzaki (strain ATCC 30864) TaxID=595528 RepID=A0A0D2X3L3_CAPO3|nr:hypothetical protein CAOG_005142 [Capsaspora owczarzaki ATCC 30864]
MIKKLSSGSDIAATRAIEAEVARLHQLETQAGHALSALLLLHHNASTEPASSSSKKGASSTTSASVSASQQQLRHAAAQSAATKDANPKLVQRTVHAALLALRRVMTQFLHAEHAASSSSSSSKDTSAAHKSKKSRVEQDDLDIVPWLHERYLEFVRLALGLLAHRNGVIQATSIGVLMELLSAEAEQLAQEADAQSKTPFPSQLFSRILAALVCNAHFGDQLASAFITGYLEKFDDVRFYTYKHLASLIAVESARQGSPQSQITQANITMAQFIQHIFLLLSSANMANTAEDLNGFHCGEPVGASKIAKASNRQDARNNRLKVALSHAEIKHDGPSKRRRNQAASEADADNAGSDDDDDDAPKRKGKGRQSQRQNKYNNDDDDDDEMYDMDLVGEDMDTSDLGIQDNSLQLHPLKNLTEHRAVFTDCWLALLRLPLPIDIYKRVLIILDEQILPHLNKPKLLIDFLTESYNVGTVAHVCCLSLKVDFDYPEFYAKLYALLDPQIFHVKYRARFFHLADIFLSSSHLPSYLVASFAKRLGRLGLSAPLPAQKLILQIIFNLILRHPSCMALVHRNLERKLGELAESVPSYKEDPFDADEPNPAATRAAESSLWELDAIKSHFSHDVTQQAAVFEGKITKIEYDVNDIVEDSYASLFSNLAGRKFKEVPLSFDTVGTLLDSQELSQLWEMS